MKQEYIVFICNKCYQYTYAKTIQKGKKCPRCGRNHIVAKIEGKIVEGPTAAMKEVKLLQEMKTGGKLPYFNSSVKEVSFIVDQKTKMRQKSDSSLFTSNKKSKNIDLQYFVNKIYEWQRNEGLSKEEGFPEYILDILVEEIEISPKNHKKLIKMLKTLKEFTIMKSGNVFLN